MRADLRSLHLIASPQMGGAETSFLRHTHALNSSGHPVCCGVRSGAKLGTQIGAGMSCTSFAMRNYLDLGSVLDIRRWIAEQDAPIVQTWASRATWLTRPPRRFLHLARLGGHYKPRHFRHAHGWIVNTEGMRRWMIDAGFPAKRVQQINNFVPDRTPCESPQPTRLNLHIPQHALLVVGLGRFFEKKGFQDLISAFSNLPVEIGGRPMHLLLIGDGPMRQQLQRQAQQNAARIHFSGWLDQPLNALQLADLFVCPSRIEPMGNVILEAWSRGLPVVCTQTDGGLELLAHGQTGLLCPVQDPASLSQTLHRLLGEPDLRQSLALSGKQHYQSHYSEQKTIESLTDFYQRMLRDLR